MALYVCYKRISNYFSLLLQDVYCHPTQAELLQELQQATKEESSVLPMFSFKLKSPKARA
jgi:hypothetical protein